MTAVDVAGLGAELVVGGDQRVVAGLHEAAVVDLARDEHRDLERLVLGRRSGRQGWKRPGGKQRRGDRASGVVHLRLAP